MGSCRDWTSGIGIRKTIKSVTILMAAAMYHIVRLSRHLSAKLGCRMVIGTQARVTRADCTMFQTRAKPMIQTDARCSHRATKMRRYCKSRLILTRHKAQM